jgi:hypothetical protein
MDESSIAIASISDGDRSAAALPIHWFMLI